MLKFRRLKRLVFPWYLYWLVTYNRCERNLFKAFDSTEISHKSNYFFLLQKIPIVLHAWYTFSDLLSTSGIAGRKLYWIKKKKKGLSNYNKQPTFAAPIIRCPPDYIKMKMIILASFIIYVQKLYKVL